MYSKPFSVAFASFTTSATPNTVTNPLVFPAPGVGKRFRYVQLIVASRWTNTGAILCIFKDTGLNQIWPGTIEIGPGGGTVVVNVPEPGYQEGDNLGLICSVAATVATQAIDIGIAYFSESVG